MLKVQAIGKAQKVALLRGKEVAETHCVPVIHIDPSRDDRAVQYVKKYGTVEGGIFVPNGRFDAADMTLEELDAMLADTSGGRKAGTVDPLDLIAYIEQRDASKAK
ncbi:MAG: hypothetical protein ABIW76_14470 [Fibrobacteria bacterium]